MKSADSYTRPTPANTAPSPRLIAMRRTSSLCIENEASWYQRHDWRPNGTCGRCGITLKEAA